MYLSMETAVVLSILTVLQDPQCHGQTCKDLSRTGERCSQKTIQGEVGQNSSFCSFLFAL